MKSLTKKYDKDTMHMGMKQLVSEDVSFTINPISQNNKISLAISCSYIGETRANAIHARFESAIYNALADAWRMCANSTDDYD